VSPVLPVSHHRRHNVILTITGLIVAALFMNVMIVHIRVFSRKDVSLLELEPTIVGTHSLEETRLLTHKEDEHPVESKASIPQKLSHNTFSACMLIKDDNDLLNEWLAYHYHVLNLRYLLVAVDPSSATSPTPIFDKWRRLTDLKIVEWSDPNFMPKVFLLTGYHISPNLIDGDASKSKWHEGHEDAEKVKADNLQITNHRFRQVTFLAACLKHMRNHKKTWTMHVDTDEFVVVNPLLRNTTRANVQMVRIPKIEDKGSMLNVVKQYYQDSTLRQKYNYPCISMPRLLFGSVEFPDNATVPRGMPGYFDSSKLETIRWQYHTDYDDKDRNAQPKVIVDVSVVDRDNDMFHKPFSIHRPSKYLCRRIDQLDFQQLQRYPITVNHYTGSWERYFNKNDTRRSERAYNAKAYVAAGHDSWMTPWLSGFVKHVGSERAKELLNDYTRTTTENDAASMATA
jgi:Glycosyl transferase family 2